VRALENALMRGVERRVRMEASCMVVVPFFGFSFVDLSIYQANVLTNLLPG